MPIFYRCVIAVLACVTALLAHAGGPQSGIAGVADRKATVNFTDRARHFLEQRRNAFVQKPFDIVADVRRRVG